MKRLFAMSALLVGLGAASAGQSCIISGSTERPAAGAYTRASAALAGRLDAVSRTQASAALAGCLDAVSRTRASAVLGRRLNGRDPSSQTLVILR